MLDPATSLYYQVIASINSANLAANLENVRVNEQMLAHHGRQSEHEQKVEDLLEGILDELRKGEGHGGQGA